MDIKNKTLVIFAIVLIIGFFGVVQNADVIFAQAQDAKEQKKEPAAQSSNQDLLAIIEQLKNQIKELQDQLAKLKSEVAEVKEELKLTKNLRKGLSDEEVVELQKFLSQFREIYPEGLVTGYFGSMTEKAVKKFQEKYGIEPVGVVGPLTRNKINESLAEEAKEEKVTICHVPLGNPALKHTLTIGKSALEAHLAHGDAIGVCPQESTPMTPTPTPPAPVPVQEPQTIELSECVRFLEVSISGTYGQRGQQGDQAGAYITDSTGNIYIVGRTEGGKINPGSEGTYDAFVAKYDTNCNHLWLRQIGGPDEDMLTGVTTDKNGNVYAVGWAWGSFDGHQAAANGNGVIVKFDNSGKKLWTRLVDWVESFYQVVADKEGGYVVYVPALPGCATQGETFEEAEAMAKDAIEGYLKTISAVFC